MDSSILRAALCALLLFCSTAAVQAADPPRQFTSRPLAGSVHVLEGFECNNVASAGDDGIVLVDTCGAKVAERLLAAAQRLSSKPLRFVINTHMHGDHTGGNAIVQKLAPVIASNNVRKWLISGNEVTKDKPSPPEALPVITFEGEMTLHLNGEEIRLLRLPPAHTDGDVVVFFKKANVVAMGDVFMAMGDVSKAPPISFGDRHYCGGMLRLMETVEFLLPQIPADAKVVPGHGVVGSRAEVAGGLEVLKQMKAIVDGGISAGKTLEQLTAERPFDKFRDSFPSWSSSDKALDSYVRNFYRELTAKK